MPTQDTPRPDQGATRTHRISDEQRRKMLHALGCERGGYRNWYAVAEPEDDWEHLVSEGLATTRHGSIHDGPIYHVTEAGKDAAFDGVDFGLRAYTVATSGDGESIYRAATRGKARYLAAISFADAMNCPMGEAFAHISSTRRAPKFDDLGRQDRPGFVAPVPVDQLSSLAARNIADLAVRSELARIFGLDSPPTRGEMFDLADAHWDAQAEGYQ